MAVTLGFSAACDSDDSDPETSAGGTGGQAPSAVGGDPLRGEGFEPTPGFDISSPDREPPSRRQVIDGVLNLNSAGSGGTGPRGPIDAGSPDGGDAS